MCRLRPPNEKAISLKALLAHTICVRGGKKMFEWSMFKGLLCRRVFFVIEAISQSLNEKVEERESAAMFVQVRHNELHL